MTETRKLTFAPFVALACALWIVAAATGSQGFTAIIGLLAIASLFFSRPSFEMPLYGWLLTASLVWITLSSLWSPIGGKWFSGSLTAGNFSISVASIRLIGVAMFSALAIGAVLKVPLGQTEKTNTAIMVVVGSLVAFIFCVFIFQTQILAFAYPGKPEEALSSGVQNVQRAANSVAVLLPVGLAAAWRRYSNLPARVAMALVSFGALIVFQNLGSQSAVMSFLLMLAGFGVIWLQPMKGIKTLLRLVAAYVFLSPLLVLAGTRVIEMIGIRLPESFQARIYAWQETVNKIWLRPFSGHGLEASGTWQDTYASSPERLEKLSSLAAPGQQDAMYVAWQHYPVIPGHPHNMPLELWVETGLIGALLVSATLWLVSLRLDLSAVGKEVKYAAAGLIGAALPLFSFAYSAWNEAYWAMLAIATCAIMLMTKRVTA